MIDNTYYYCPNCDTEILNDEFLPGALTCPNCNKTWETDFECDYDNYWCWITDKEIIEE